MFTRLHGFGLWLVTGLLVWGALLPFTAGAESAFIPRGYEVSRYNHLWEKSPFSSATPTAEAASDAVWLLTGISNFDNYPFATLTNKQTRKSIALAAGESSGPLKLVHAEWAPDFNNSFAVVEINGVEKRLEFDQKSLQILAAQAGSSAPSPTPQITNNTRSPLPNGVQNKPKTTDNEKRPVPRRRVILRR